MLFIISRASDEFMDKHPDPSWPPHKDAFWSERYNDWLIDIMRVDELVDLTDGKGVRLIVRQVGTGLPHVEIDDVTR